MFLQFVDSFPLAATELEWICPAAKMPDDLQRSLNLINIYLEEPFDLNGKKALQMLSKSKPAARKPKRRTRGSDGDEPGGLDDFLDEAEGPLRERGNKRKAKKKQEKENALSAQFIEDSDAELGDDDTFWAAEAALRERVNAVAEKGGPAIQGAGTKKRKKKEDHHNEGTTRKRARKSQSAASMAEVVVDSSDEELGGALGSATNVSRRQSTPDTSPDVSNNRNMTSKLRKLPSVASSPPSSSEDETNTDHDGIFDTKILKELSSQGGRRLNRVSSSAFSDLEDDENAIPTLKAARPTKRLVLSDDDD